MSEAPASAFLIDIDGVVLKDDEPLPGAAELVAWLLASGRRFLFLTNYPSQTPADLASRMAGSGIEVPPTHFFTSAMATAEFLDKQAGTRRRAFVVGEGALVHELYKIGFTISETDADFVVLGETRHYNFEMIQRAAALIQRGARFVATNPDVAGPFGRPSCGAFAAPIERITGKSPFYVGKPSRLHDAGGAAPHGGPLRRGLHGRGQHGDRHHRRRPVAGWRRCSSSPASRARGTSSASPTGPTTW